MEPETHRAVNWDSEGGEPQKWDFISPQEGKGASKGDWGFLVATAEDAACYPSPRQNVCSDGPVMGNT
jgi:hypothetical protein